MQRCRFQTQYVAYATCQILNSPTLRSDGFIYHFYKKILFYIFFLTLDFLQENDKSMKAVETRHINTRTLNAGCLRICFARYLEAVAVTNERLASSNAVKGYGTGNSGTAEHHKGLRCGA